MAILKSYPGASDPFREGTHSGLDFAYGEGKVRDDNAVTHVAAGSITLADNTDNYIEVDATTGTVSTNTTGFTAGKLPLYKATALSGVITEVRDDRCFFSVGGGGGECWSATSYGFGVLTGYVITFSDSGHAVF